MDRTYLSGAVGSAPTAPASPSSGYPTAGNPSTGVPATKPGPYWYYMITEEIRNVIAGAGLTPTQGDVTQLVNAILTIIDGPNHTTQPQFNNSTKLATTEFVQVSGYKYSQIAQFSSGPVALNASHCGKLIDLASAYSGALTLPPATGLVDGAVIHIWSGSNSSVSVQRSGTDVIYLNNGTTVNSITLQSGDALVLTRFGASAWVAIGGSAQLGSSGVFGANLATNGYQKLPSGLIIQWGNQVVTNVQTSYSYPIAFPNASLKVILTDGDAAAATITFGANVVSASQYSAICSSASALASFIAIGY